MKIQLQKKVWIPLVAAVSALLLVSAVLVSWLVILPHFTFTVTDQGNSVTVRSWKTDPESVLEKLELDLREEDVFTAEKTKKGTHITVSRAQRIEITVKGETQTVYTQGETVEQLLTRLNIGTTDPWQVSVSLDEKTIDGMTIQVDHVEKGPYSAVEEIPFAVLYCKDPSLPSGQEEIMIEGVNGQQENTGEAVYVNGEIESVTVTQNTVLTEPVKQIVAVGTGEKEGEERKYPLVGDNFLLTADGQCLYYSYVDVYNATAYTSWIDDVTGTTACGTPARVGAVAVDPKVIPYYTKMYIVSKDGVFDYGVSSAEDCGGAIKGKIIDLFFNTLEDCYAFGRRDIFVYFLTEEPA